MTDRKSTRLNSRHEWISRIASFFLMIRRPPRSTLFPSTPPFRSYSALDSAALPTTAPHELTLTATCDPGYDRSEEHTAELQARVDISYCVFFFNDTAPPEIYPLSLHAPLPILQRAGFCGAADNGTPRTHPDGHLRPGL